MEFLFSCSARQLTRSLRSLVSYRVKHLKRNSISTRAHELFSIYYIHFEINGEFAIWWLPAVRFCSQSLFLPANDKATEKQDNQTDFKAALPQPLIAEL